MVNAVDSTHYLLQIRLLRDKVPSFSSYPFCLPAIRCLDVVEPHPAVTFILGENGAGKSTLLEAIAVAWGFNAEGGSRNFRFSTHASHSPLHHYLRLSKNFRRPRDGYFFRAESYYNLGTEIDRLDEDPMGGPPIIDSYGRRSLHRQSHGESFLALFAHRFGGKGLYILDEPEAALSPNRQLAFLARMHELVQDRSQFIIATHSPIIMAYPNAKLLWLSETGIRQISYQDTEHYRITADFLNHFPQSIDDLLSP